MILQDALNLAEELLSSTDYVSFINALNMKNYMRARIITLNYEYDIRSSRLEDFVINLIMEED